MSFCVSAVGCGDNPNSPGTLLHRIAALVLVTCTLVLSTYRTDFGICSERRDENIGRLLAALDRLGLRERTIVVLQSDNGHSLVEVIGSASAPSPHKVFHWQTGPAKHPSWAVREGPWKLLGNPQDTSKKAPLTAADRLFLANLENDVSETTNVAAEHPDIVARLKKLHEEWVKQVEEQ